MYTWHEIRRHGTRCWCGKVHWRGRTEDSRRHRSALYCLVSTLRGD